MAEKVVTNEGAEALGKPPLPSIRTSSGEPLGDAYNRLLDEGDEPINSPLDEQARFKRDSEVKVLQDFALHPGFKAFTIRLKARAQRQLKKLNTVSLNEFPEEQAFSRALSDEVDLFCSMFEDARKIILNEEEK